MSEAEKILEQEILGHLKAVQDSSVRCLKADDMTAYKVLAAEEARLMDALRAIWSQRD